MFEHLSTPAELLEFRLGTALAMEHDSLSMLGDLEEAAVTPEIKQMFSHHADETRHQIENLEQVFGLLGLTPAEQPSPTTKGLAKEGKSLVRKTDQPLRDDVVLAAALETEHFEIAAYETLIATASAAGAREAVSLLEENLGQEKHTSEELLTKAKELAASAA